jgi:hypothetical protein
MYNRTCSAGTHVLAELTHGNVNIIMRLSNSISGQLGNLG